MKELIADWGKLIPFFMIGVGCILLLVAFVARNRNMRSEGEQENEEEEYPAVPRSRMAPLPRLLSTEHSERRDGYE
ncbi:MULTISPECIES: hypothetical protein [Bradyrhizobium]|uniref:hypothetical protein n=1 Tax=Bradyrhizobium brasilense TaxID=1419277 RepID=UPI001456B270|nr:hypothetical protein [Bradyrhizobium brasilense]NLS69147.1 hypothetical protein [Bradyrhizobium brasilense]